MKDKPILGIDVDGTLSDTMQRWIYFYKKDFNVEVSEDDLFIYDFSKIFPFVDEKIMRKYFEMSWEDWKNIKVIDSFGIKNINMVNDFYNVKIVTSTWGKLENVKKWLKYNKIKFNELVFVEHSEDKKNSCDILIDDSLKNINTMYDAGKLGILLKQAWNKKTVTEKIKKYILVANNWEEVLELLNDIKNDKKIYNSLLK